MEALLKVAALAAIMLFCGLGMAACASLDKAAVNAALASPKADAAAIGVERVVTALAVSFSTVIADPKADLDRVKLARQVADAVDLLDEARTAFDARQGGVSALVSRAVFGLSRAVPAETSTTARLALSAAFAGLSIYAQALDAPGAAAPPSPALIDARARADAAIKALRDALPPPES